MSHRAQVPLLLAAASLAACWRSQTSPTDLPPAVASDVSVELSSVTLGEECGTGWSPAPPILPAKAPAARAPAAMPASPAASMAPPNPADRAFDEEPGVAPRRRYECEQTSMQLSLLASGASPAMIQIKQVELLDAAGRLIGRLESRTPTRWLDDHYQPWDQSIPAGQHVAASYVLSSPNWHAMEGGSWAQRGKTFQLRVTLVVGSRARTVEKQAITPMMMEPAVPT